MTWKDEIKNAIETTIKKLLFDNTLDCEVLEVNTSAATVKVVSRKNELEYTEVRLVAAVGDTVSGIVAFPKVGSRVLISFVDGMETNAFVSQYSEIDSYKINVAGLSVFLDKDTVKLNGDALGGLVKAKVLEAQLNKNNELLQAILTIIRGAPIPEPGNGVPSALQAALVTALTGKTLGDFSTLENDKVKHG